MSYETPKELLKKYIVTGDRYYIIGLKITVELYNTAHSLLIENNQKAPHGCLTVKRARALKDELFFKLSDTNQSHYIE